jgi:hypothetical protein
MRITVRLKWLEWFGVFAPLDFVGRLHSIHLWGLIRGLGLLPESQFTIAVQSTTKHSTR